MYNEDDFSCSCGADLEEYHMKGWKYCPFCGDFLNKEEEKD